VSITRLTSSDVGASFQTELLGREVGPYKQYRELLKNGFEAIESFRASNVVVNDTDDGAMIAVEDGFEGRIEIIREPYYLDQYGVAKMAFVDNGIGMTEPEVRKYFSTLFASGKTHGIGRNHGIGAKIASAKWNPYGVEIRSWRDGVGVMARLRYDDESGEYGLERFDLGDGHQSDVFPLSESPDEGQMKPALIKDHGTCIVLLGTALEHDTTVKPNDQYTHSGYWLHQAINNSFYRTPSDLDIVARVHEIDGKIYSRTLYGHEPFFVKNAVAHGSHEMNTAVVHWIILDESKSDFIRSSGQALYQACSVYKKFGHVAVVHENELFDLEVKDDAIPTLQRFGIIAGHNNVVLYIEPKPRLGLTMNLVRTALVSSSGDPLPWSEWAREFYETMPEELRVYVEAKMQTGGKSDRDYLVEQISKHLDLLSIKGKSVASPTTTSVETVRGREPAPDRSKAPRAHRDPRPAPRLGDADNGTRILEWIPTVTWGTNEDGLKNRAGRFTSESKSLVLNADFPVYTSLLDEARNLVVEEKRVKHEGRLETIVRRPYMLQVVWTLLSAMHFRNLEGWVGAEFDKLISPEAITASVLPRKHLIDEIRRNVKGNPAFKLDLVPRNDDEAAA
jgi:hypothetical protein